MSIKDIGNQIQDDPDKTLLHPDFFPSSPRTSGLHIKKYEAFLFFLIAIAGVVGDIWMLVLFQDLLTPIAIGILAFLVFVVLAGSLFLAITFYRRSK